MNFDENILSKVSNLGGLFKTTLWIMYNFIKQIRAKSVNFIQTEFIIMLRVISHKNVLQNSKSIGIWYIRSFQKLLKILL